jgi:hypothetical protein
MDNVLYQDRPTNHRVLIGNKKRVVHARHDWEGRFVRFVVQRTKGEMEAERKSYLPAKVGIKSWFEVFEYNFVGAK